MQKPYILILLFAILCIPLNGQTPYEEVPFSTDQQFITVWNGEAYVPLFIKGMNLGIAKPGTFPGELAATKSDYARWLSLIQEAGFNAIRLYTLHYPHFYAVLDSFNAAHPNKPIFIFQGIWLEEEIPNYDDDLHDLTDSFREELMGNIRAIHGNAVIPARPGKASGSYNVDVSRYLIGYIIGREIHPPEVWHTNDIHGESSYNGFYLSITDASPTEVWMTSLLDEVISFEKSEYNTMRPVSFSSWPTLDPISHEAELNRYEDSVTIDLKKLDISNAPAGYFASYHAYPYYPDFVSKQNSYQDEQDYLGQNSYLAYLKDLKSHYSQIPLMVAEFGTSTSWGIAHYAQSGIHHGGASEREQGEAYLRMFQNITESELAGGIQFAWIDEWFKRTWITDPLDDDPDARVNWHNITAAEQNFGLLGYRKKGELFTPWESVCSPCLIEEIEAGANYDFLQIKLNMGEAFNPEDTIWLGIDTYADALGESILPNGEALNHRSEFALMITQDVATLYVTEAYDTYGIWHGTSNANQQYQSTSTDGSPWNIVRWKNNNTLDEIQYVGRLGVNRLNLPKKSTDGVIIHSSSIEIRLPWTLIQFVDPSQKKVLHDDRGTPERESLISEGIALDVFYQEQSYSTQNRFIWDNWNYPSDLEEYTKTSYSIIKDGLESIPSAPIAHTDNYTLETNNLLVSAVTGVLSNDVSFGTANPEAYLFQSPQHGILQFNTDGSFYYEPLTGFSGIDQFRYQLRVGSNWSEPVTVSLNVENPLQVKSDAMSLELYPNPSKEVLNFNSNKPVQSIQFYTPSGRLIFEQHSIDSQQVHIGQLPMGIYFARIAIEHDVIIRKIIKQ